MAILAALSGLIAVLTSWIVGLRLLWLARRTRQAPELLIGSALVLAGGIWSPCTAIGRQATALPDDVRVLLVFVGALCGVSGMAMLSVFNWRVFRPHARWASALAVAMGLGLLGAFVAQTATAGWLDYARNERGPWLVALWIGIASYLWSTSEAWQQHRMLMRRQALGLADPVVVDRMRLWALAMSAAFAGATLLAVCQVTGIPVAGTPLGLVTSAVVGLATAVFLWLAFLPPAAYLARVRAAAAGA